MTVDSQACRIRRLAAWLVTVGYLATTIAAVPLLPMTDELVAGWYNPIAGIVATLPGLIAGPLALLRDLRWSRIALVTAQIGFLAAILLWFLAWEGQHTANIRVSWLVMFPGIAAFAYALVRPLAESLAQLVLGSVGVGLVVAVGSFAGLTHGLVADVLWPIVLTSVFMMLAKRFIHTAVTFDAARAEAVEDAVVGAGFQARARERARFDALVHDRVIATLIAVEPGVQDPEVIAQARAAVDKLERLASGQDWMAGALRRDEALARFRAAARAVDDEVEVMVADAASDAGGPADVGYPAAVVDAISEALGEAVRNGVRHAGHGAHIAVLIEAAPGSLRVTVADDGVGFDPDAVPPARLGIAVSIHRRMAAIPGGWSRLRSVAVAPAAGAEEDAAAHSGTTVQVGWAS